MIRKMLLSIVTAGFILLSTSIGYATTVTKIMTWDYVGQTVTIQGKITEHLGGTFYHLTDYTGEFIRVNLAGMGLVDKEHDISIEGVISLRDNVLTLEARRVFYDQESINDTDTPRVTIGKLLSNDGYIGSRVSIEGTVKEYLGDDYVMFYDRKGEHIVVKLNYNQIGVNERVIIYGVPDFANQRLEFSLDHFEYK